MKYILSLITLSFLFACKSQKEKTVLLPSNHIGITIIDSTSAATQMLSDAEDGFFQSLSIVDMAIQLRTDKKYDDKATMLRDYKALLTNEVSNFTNAEKQLMEDVMARAKVLTDKLNPNIWPSHIDLIKVKTNHYGPDVYYTREDAIILPENVLVKENASSELLPVMLHEIFHILSRYDLNLREELYGLINFKPHGKEVKLVASLENKVLTNPDGVTRGYAITLDNGKNRPELAIPLLTSAQPYYSKTLPSFFAYLKFDLYLARPLPDGSLLIDADGAANTTLSPEHQNNYFQHIADNTQYVIHPEEIMADNFMMAVRAYESGDYSSYSKVGKKLLDEVTEVLKAYKK